MGKSQAVKRYALFRNEKQVSKAHSTKTAVATEAFEHSAVIVVPSDFCDEHSEIALAEGYSIREVK